jgi:hypothetical protein
MTNPGFGNWNINSTPKKVAFVVLIIGGIWVFPPTALILIGIWAWGRFKNRDK